MKTISERRLGMLKDTIKPWDLGEIKEASFVPTLPCERVINTIVEKNDFNSFVLSPPQFLPSISPAKRNIAFVWYD